VLDELMEASHLALFESTGRPVTGVFQTLSAGNAGHLVPGRSTPPATAGAVVLVVGGGAWVVEVVAEGSVRVVLVVVVASVVAVTECLRLRAGRAVEASGAVVAGAVLDVAPVRRGGEARRESAEALPPDRTISAASAARARDRTTGSSAFFIECHDEP
jgi:hypothetical protein